MQIDSEIFKFVELLQETDPPKGNNTELEQMKGMEPIIDLGEVKDMTITNFDESDGSTVTIFASVGKKMIGLPKNNFKDFKAVILSLLDVEPFSSKCTMDFLLNRSFEWLISVYKSKKADSNLSAYLLDRIEKETDYRHFYFPIEALAIEKQFTIGNVIFTFFSEEEIQALYVDFKKTKEDTSFEEFKKMYKNLSKINAHIKVNGIMDRAEQIAMSEIEVAVDILKSFCISYSISPYIQIFDLEYRIKRSGHSTFIDIPEGNIKESSIQIRNSGGIVPVQLNTKTIDKFAKNGLNLFTQFIANKKNNELYFVIIEMIHRLSEIVSTKSNYDKIVKAISLSESVLLPKIPTGKSKGLTRIKKALPKIVTNDSDRKIIGDSLVGFYKIRDGYLHNNIRHPIDQNLLFYFLSFQRVFILRMIKLSNSFSSLKEVLDYFDCN